MQKERNREKHISIQKLSAATVTVALLVMLLLLATIYNCTVEYHAMHENTEIYIQCEKDADQLKEASDYLTEQVRLFVMTCDLKYLQNYFEEAEDKKRRDRAVEDLAGCFGESDILEKLQKALASSRELMEREYYAMKLVVLAKGYGEESLPQTIRSVTLLKEDMALSPEDKQALAQTMVFDEVYEECKNEIYLDVENSLKSLVNATHNAQLKSSSRLSRRLKSLQIQLFLIVFLLVLFAFGTGRMILKPLRNYVKNMKSGEKLPQKGVAELSYVAETYNSIYEENREMLEVLKKEAVDAHEKYLQIQEEKRKSEVIMGLSSEFDAIYLVDFKADIMIPYRLPDDVSWNRERKYQEGIRDYAEKYILPEDREMFLCEGQEENIQRHLKSESAYSITFRSRTAGNKLNYIDMYFAKVFNADRDGHVVLGFKNVTEQVLRVQEQTKERIRTEQERDDAVHASRAKSAFLFNMSHDIRTPMNAIIGFTTVARKYMDRPEELERCLSKIDVSSSYLLDLINDVLDMSQIESGQLRLEKRPCSLKEQLGSVIEMLSTQIAEKGICFTEDISLQNEIVYADPLNFRRIFVNVIGNAVKFTAPKGSVHLTARQKESTAEDTCIYEFLVKDTGIGMSEEFMERMFDTFERESQSVATNYNGTGLGLSISKNLVELMGGTITAESKKGVGTTFSIVLEFEPADMAQNHESANEEASDRSTREHFGKNRILVAEDNELNCEIVMELLTDAGFQIQIVNNGSEAVEAVKGHAAGYFDMVLMDIQMPVMNGYEAAQAIRAMDREDATVLPIIALSANAMEEDRRKSARSGMNAHIAKPIDLQELMGTIEEYI